MGSDVKGMDGDLPGTVTSKDFGFPSAPTAFKEAQRTGGSMGTLSGAHHMAFLEQSNNATKKKWKAEAAQFGRHKLFAQREKKRLADNKAQRKQQQVT